MPKKEIVVKTNEVIVRPPDNWLSPCMHPLPTLEKDGTLTNKEFYKWLSNYQKALTDCDTKIYSIKKFYQEK